MACQLQATSAAEDKGEIIESVEETFDGFLKLPNEARRPQ
jgi:hypothetical protein